MADRGVGGVGVSACQERKVAQNMFLELNTAFISGDLIQYIWHWTVWKVSWSAKRADQVLAMEALVLVVLHATGQAEASGLTWAKKP